MEQKSFNSIVVKCKERPKNRGDPICLHEPITEVYFDFSNMKNQFTKIPPMKPKQLFHIE